MPLSEARKQANKKWNDANMKERYDRIQLVVPKGKKEVIQQYADGSGESMSAYIVEAVDMRMSAGGSYGIPAAAPGNMDISRFISHAVIERISAVLPEGETIEDYIRTAVLAKLEADEANK